MGDSVATTPPTLHGCNACGQETTRVHMQTRSENVKEVDIAAPPFPARALLILSQKHHEMNPADCRDRKEICMRTQQVGLAVVLAGFSALTAYTVYQHGYIGFFQLMVANTATITAGVDLTIALGLILLWMGKDAQERGISPLPYVLLTVALGSVGPLLYLIRRADKEHTRPTITA